LLLLLLLLLLLFCFSGSGTRLVGEWVTVYLLTMTIQYRVVKSVNYD
jgi:hypothetical protein